MIILVALVAARVAAPGPSSAPRDEPGPNVILVVIDTLRARHLSCYGYQRQTTPFLDSIAEGSALYEYAISTAPWTAPAMASLFTSFYPTAHGVTDHIEKYQTSMKAAVLSEQFKTLAEVLKDNGYQTVGITANAWVADYLGFAQGFDSFVTRDQATAEQLNDEFFGLLRSLHLRRSKPSFLYVHYMDPHWPYDPRKGHGYDGVVEEYDYLPEHQESLNRYDAEIHYLDAQIRRLFEFLSRGGFCDNAVVVVASDHGEQFGEYGNISHGHTVHNVEVHVPLLIKAEGLQPARIDTTVSLVDVYPTLLELLEIPLEHPVQGISLISGLDRRRRTSVLSEITRTGDFRAITTPDGMKLVREFTTGDTLIQRIGTDGWALYDSRTDYWELAPLPEEGVLELLASEYESLQGESLLHRQGVDVLVTDLDEATVIRLKALGYSK